MCGTEFAVSEHPHAPNKPETAFHVTACCALPGDVFPSVHRKLERDREREQQNKLAPSSSSLRSVP